MVQIDDEKYKQVMDILSSASATGNDRRCLFRNEKECSANCTLWLSGSDGISGKCCMEDVARKHNRKIENAMIRTDANCK